jgi:hypothetical protein
MTTTTKKPAHIKPLSRISTETLKDYAMEAAHGIAPSDVSYTAVVRILASRLKADPKKIRRQARTKFWQ